LAGAIEASFSSLGGLVVWVAFAPAAFQQSRKFALIWILAAAATIGLYSVDYPFGQQGGALALSTDSVLFVFAWIGSAVGGGDPQLALTLGIASAVCLAVALILMCGRSLRTAEGMPRSVMVWSDLSAFAVGVAILIALDHENDNLNIASRFLAFTVMSWIAFLVIGLATVVQVAGAQNRDSGRAGPRTETFLAAACFGIVLLTVAGTIVTSRYGFERGLKWEVDQRMSETCVLEEPLTDECLGTFGSAERLRPLVSILKDERLAIFRAACITTAR
jgi:hypothetical protein